MKSLLNLSIKPTRAGWRLILAFVLFTLILFGSTFSWALEPVNKGITRIPLRLYLTLVLVAGFSFFAFGLWGLVRRKIQAFDIRTQRV